MTLYLTSDEKVYGNVNTRTNFVNSIQPDFFLENGNNITLKEIFFDAKFPTLINESYPHVITLIDGKQHNLDEFPDSNYKTLRSFLQLFKKSSTRESASMRVEQDFTHSLMAEIESNVVIEIHPRLNFAVSYAFLTDITINTKEEIVEYLNREMFPFHKVKPLKILDTGKVSIDSNLDIFFSSNMINLLGFGKQSEKVYLSERMTLPSFEIVEKLSKYIDDELTDIPLKFDDELARLEYEGYEDIYSHYRKLITNKPQGKILIDYLNGEKKEQIAIAFNLDIFHKKYALISYKSELKYINKVLKHYFFSKIKELAYFGRNDGDNSTPMDELLDYFLKSKKFLNLQDFGGFVTLQKKR